MNTLVLTNSTGKDITTSLIIADVFEKEHKNVLADIKNLSCSEQFRELNFQPSYYTSSQGKELPMYEITKDGFSFLVMGYTGDKASAFKEKFINEFNKRELMLKDDDYIMNRALEISSKRMKSLEQQLLAKNEILAIQETVIKESAPKIEYYDKVLQSKGLIPINIIANELGMTAQKLNKLLKEQKIQYKVKETWVLHAEYRDKGYTKHETFPYTDEDGNNYTSQHMYWYEKGREFIHKVINDLRKVA